MNMFWQHASDEKKRTKKCTYCPLHIHGILMLEIKHVEPWISIHLSVQFIWSSMQWWHWNFGNFRQLFVFRCRAVEPSSTPLSARIEYRWLMLCIRGSEARAFVIGRIGANLLHIKLYILRAASLNKIGSSHRMSSLFIFHCSRRWRRQRRRWRSVSVTINTFGHETAVMCVRVFPQFHFFFFYYNSLLASRWLFELHEIREIAQFLDERKPNWKLYRSDGLFCLFSCVLSSRPLVAIVFVFVHFELRVFCTRNPGYWFI